VAVGLVGVLIGMVLHVVEVERDEAAANAVERRRQRSRRPVRLERSASMKYICVGLVSLLLGLLLVTGDETPAGTGLLGWLLVLGGVVGVAVGVVGHTAEVERRR